MRRKVIFELQARLEFEEAIAWYDEHQPGLGDKFKTEVVAAIESVLNNPTRFPLRGERVRRIGVRTFKKYGVFYRVERDFIVVAAVFHSSRNPEKLQRRLK